MAWRRLRTTLIKKCFIFSFFNMINVKFYAKPKINFSAYCGKTVGAAPSDTANSGEEADSLPETTEQEDRE